MFAYKAKSAAKKPTNAVEEPKVRPGAALVVVAAAPDAVWLAALPEDCEAADFEGAAPLLVAVAAAPLLPELPELPLEPPAPPLPPLEPPVAWGVPALET